MNGLKKFFRSIFCGRATDKKYLEPVINHLPDAFIIIDRSGIVTSINKACCNLLGYDESEIIGQSASLFFVDTNAPEQEQNEIYLGKILDKLVVRGFVNNLEVIFLTKSKKKIPVMFNGVVLRDKKNNITGVLGLARDIREIKRNMGKIRVLQKISFLTLDDRDISVMMRDIGNYIKEFFEVERATYYVVKDGYLKSVYASDYNEKITLKIPQGIAGYSAGIKESYYTNDAPADPHFYPQIDAQSGYKTKNILVCPVLEKDGIIGLVELINKDDDFTEQDKKDLEEIVNLAKFVISDRQNKIKLKELAKFPDENPNMVIRATSEGKILYFNPASEHFMKFFSCNVDGYLPDKLRKVVIESAKDLADKKLEINCCADKIYFFTIKHITSENYVNLYGSDVTERKLAEEELKKNYEIQNIINFILHLQVEGFSLQNILEEALKKILSLKWLSFETKGAIFLTSDDGKKLVLKVQSCSSEFLCTKCKEVKFGECMCGLAAISGKIEFSSCLDERHTIRYEGIAEHGHYCVPIISNGKTLGVINTYLEQGHLRNKKEEECLFAMADILAGIIERKKSEQEKENLYLQLLKSDRLASVGELASGLAHEIGNPLQTVLGNADLLLMDNEKSEELKAIKDAALHARTIIKNLLDFSRQGEMIFVKEDIHSLIDKTILLYGKQLELKNIKVIRKYQTDLPKITVSPSHIEQVFLNIITNAQKSMPKGGTLTITTNVAANVNSQTVDLHQPLQNYIEISFKDTGIGIPKENLLRLFEPFFTTKKDGTGLGLSVSYGIVKQHG
ncbi:MAG: PAS domain S-box protein, partial [Elusimicrobiota bacterium]|nr:PAS domain S-box protein [Elusimicrobiota bacterium]